MVVVIFWVDATATMRAGVDTRILSRFAVAAARPLASNRKGSIGGPE